MMSKIVHAIDFVSVIYNHPLKMIQRMIDSINNVMQYCPHFEYKIIVQNNNEKHLDKMPLVDHILLSDKNVGYCGGNNSAIKKSSGDYIIIINPDIVLNNSLCIDWFSIYFE